MPEEKQLALDALVAPGRVVGRLCVPRMSSIGCELDFDG